MILKFKSRDPRRNLPIDLYRKRGESNFVGLFERAFLQENKKGVGGRQFAVSGFGVADFIWLNLSGLSSFKNNKDINPIDFFKNHPLMAFEMKLGDWKRALHQAYRYSYFADHVVVVLPMNKTTAACNNLALFKYLDIGLWGLDSDKTITKFFTSHSSVAKSENARNKAVDLIGRKINFRMFAEQAQSFL
ncbi:MAG: hypothetical protein HQM15_01265 [Deltaproteobacteria bacterium]|nr:hypothetical protein [Deltaproteobacteria bacterium]